MSAPHLELKEVEFLSLGFMTNNAIHALGRVVSGEKAIDSDTRALKKMAAFLDDISSGAEFITSGNVPAGFNASRSLQAFNYAMGPTETLKKLLKNEDVRTFFRDISSAVARARDGQSTMEDRPQLEQALAFLGAFYAWVVAELNTRQPVLGMSRLRKGVPALSW